jgi:uncharacterized membrane protein
MNPAGPTSDNIRAIMRWLMAALFIAAGIAHLRAPQEFLAITPDWVPLAPQVIFYTGLFELIAAAALITRRFRIGAGIALALYSLAVWPANIKHAFEGIHVAVIPDTWWYHAPRLALQPVVIWWALYASGAIDWPWRKREVTPSK